MDYIRNLIWFKYIFYPELIIIWINISDDTFRHMNYEQEQNSWNSTCHSIQYVRDNGHIFHYTD
jgi:hypothetical protein